MKRLLILIAGLSALLPAQDSQTRATVVRASGDALVSVRADQARLRFGVVTKSGTAERAREKNAERATNVIARLRELLGPDADIKTANYSLNKSYLDEFVASNIVQVNLTDPKVAAKAIDVAIKAGATVVGGMESSALDEQ